MDKDIKEKWVNALRSGEYKQAHRSLRVVQPDGGYAHCCLGVLMELTPEEGTFMNYAKLGHLVNDPGCGGAMKVLIEMNDTEKRSFKQIADHIEANL